MGENYNISASPHIRSKATTGNIMLMVLIALLPATAFGVYNFGLSALLVVVITTASAVLTEYAYQKLGFKAEYGLSDMVESAYNYVKNQK